MSPRGLGARETGGSSALPIWIGYMGKVLKGVPEKPLQPPEGVIAIGTDYYLREFPPKESAPLPLLPTQVPPSDAPSALPSTAAPPPVSSSVPAPMAPVVIGTGGARPTPPPAPPPAMAPAQPPPERTFGTPRSPFQPMDLPQ